MKVLITGGAGFIGSRLASRLVRSGASVTVYDNLSSQVHGENADFSAALQSIAHCVRGDIRDRALLERVTVGQETIVHLAAETGTGQSMYSVDRYEEVNIRGTALLLDILVNQPSPALKKLVVASSRAIYGEGRYRCDTHGEVYPASRTHAALVAGRFEPLCPQCAGRVSVMTTPEAAPLAPSSFYGLTKQVQEQMILMFAATLNVDAIALRYQNVYGPGQSLNNPYTGLLAVFSNQVRDGKPLNIFEDGLESRDFVYVDDVVEATALCVDPTVRGIYALNVGSGHRTTVLDVAQSVVRILEGDVPVRVSGAFRLGDIRHNVADLTRLEALTGFVPQWKFGDGLAQFLQWACLRKTHSGFEASMGELARRNLMGYAMPAVASS
jgi:dTDP-L-rhamnose 4-epimerase